MLPGRRPTLTGESPTTLGAEELNVRVRHGNECDLFAITTRLPKGTIITTAN